MESVLKCTSIKWEDLVWELNDIRNVIRRTRDYVVLRERATNNVVDSRMSRRSRRLPRFRSRSYREMYGRLSSPSANGFFSAVLYSFDAFPRDIKLDLKQLAPRNPIPLCRSRAITRINSIRVAQLAAVFDNRLGAESWTIIDRYLARANLSAGRYAVLTRASAASGRTRARDLLICRLINLSPQPCDKFRLPAPFAPITHRIRVNERGWFPGAVLATGDSDCAPDSYVFLIPDRVCRHALQ